MYVCCFSLLIIIIIIIILYSALLEGPVSKRFTVSIHVVYEACDNKKSISFDLTELTVTNRQDIQTEFSPPLLFYGKQCDSVWASKLSRQYSRAHLKTTISHAVKYTLYCTQCTPAHLPPL